MYKLLMTLGIIFFVSCQSGKQSSENTGNDKSEIVLVEDTLNISGMHCDMCEKSIEKGVNELEGISFVKASLEDSSTIVKYDAAKTDLAQIEKAVEKRGYKIKSN